MKKLNIRDSLFPPGWARRTLGAIVSSLANQTLSYGALTLEGAGGTKPADSNGTQVSLTSYDSLVSGTLGTYVPSVDANGRLIFTGGGAGAPGGAVLRCSHAGGTVDITIATNAAEYSVASDAELSAALTSVGTTDNLSVTLRSTGTRYAAITLTKSFATRFTLKSEARAMAEIEGVTFSGANANITLSGLDIHLPAGTTARRNNIIFDGAGTNSAGIKIVGNLLRGPVAIDPNDADLANGWYDYDGDAVRGNDTGDTTRAIAFSSSPVVTNFEMTDNELRDLETGAKFANTAGTFVYARNWSHRIYADHLFVGCSSGVSPTSVNIHSNVFQQPTSIDTDTGNPHTDFIQFRNPSMTQDWTGITVEGNAFFIGNARGHAQCVFMDDAPVGYFYSATVRGNVIAGRGSVHGITIGQAKDCLVEYNTVAFANPTDAANTVSIKLLIGTGTSAGATTIRNNIAEAISTGGAGTFTTTDNVVLGLLGATIPYDTAFVSDGAGGFNPQNVQNALAWFTPEAAYNTAGAHVISTFNMSETAGVITINDTVVTASPGYTANFVDTNGTAYHTATNTALPNDAQMTFYLRAKMQDVSKTQRLFDTSGRCEISNAIDKLRVVIKDSVNITVYDAVTTNPVFTLGTEVRVYLAVNLATPSISILIDGAAPAMTVTTPIAAGNGLIGLARPAGFLAFSTGGFPTDAHVSDYYITTGDIIPESSFHDSGAAKDLTGVGTPKVWLGGDMTANERAGNAAQGWNDSYNKGSATVTTASATYTDVGVTAASTEPGGTTSTTMSSTEEVTGVS